MKFVSKIVAAALCAVALVPAMAQEKKSSLAISGNYSQSEGSDGSGTVFLSYGYLMSPRMETGLISMINISETSLMTSIGAQVQLYMNPVGKVGSWNPYVSASGSTLSMTMDTQEPVYSNVGGFVVQTGTRTVTSTSTGTSIAAHLGIANTISENTEFFIQVGGTSNTYSGSTTSGTAIDFGLKVRF